VRAEGLGQLAVTRLAFGHSVDLAFAADAGDDPGLFGEELIREASAEIPVLLNLHDDAELLRFAQAVGERTMVHYMRLLDVLVEEDLNVGVRTPTSRAYISAHRAAAVRVLLDQPLSVTVERLIVLGTLYEADAAKNGFRVDPKPEGERNILGNFREDLREQVRQAWGREVRAEILVTRSVLAWALDPKATYELVGLEVLGPGQRAAPADASTDVAPSDG
jgi:hypothetical protein